MSKEKPSMTILPEQIRELNNRTKIINDINSERIRQDFKWGKQIHSFDTWLTILVEEVGEVAQAIQADKHWGKDSDAQDLRKELIQVAAVAAAVVEQIDGGSYEKDKRRFDE